MMNRCAIGVLLSMWPLLATATELKGEHAIHAMPSAETATSGADVPEGAWSPTGMEITREQRCVLAARGVVMLDNASWAVCGGKPKGVPQSAVASPVNTHAGH